MWPSAMKATSCHSYQPQCQLKSLMAFFPNFPGMSKALTFSQMHSKLLWLTDCLIKQRHGTYPFPNAVKTAMTHPLFNTTGIRHSYFPWCVLNCYDSPTVLIQHDYGTYKLHVPQSVLHDYDPPTAWCNRSMVQSIPLLWEWESRCSWSTCWRSSLGSPRCRYWHHSSPAERSNALHSCTTTMLYKVQDTAFMYICHGL